MAKEKLKYHKIYAVIIGIGLALYPIHNKWLLDTTSIDGQATLFLPVFGTAIFILATLFYMRDNWKELDWGGAKIRIPLFIITYAIGFSGVTGDTWGNSVAPLFMGVSMLFLYIVARRLGKDIFLPLAIGAGIASFGIIISGLLNLGVMTGGLVFERNYDIATGYILLGVALLVGHKYQPVLAGLALVALFMSGSPEAVFAIGVVGIVILVRRDWGKKLALTLAPVVVIGVMYFSVGYGQELYSLTAHAIRNDPSVPYPEQSHRNPAGTAGVEGDTILERRWAKISGALTDIKPFGEGYILTDFSRVSMVHNVPLVIVQQLGWTGIAAGIAWLWVTLWCAVKTKWTYIWTFVLALSVFDHYIWTQLAPLWWAIVGVSTTSNIETDKVFKDGQK